MLSVRKKIVNAQWFYSRSIENILYQNDVLAWESLSFHDVNVDIEKFKCLNVVNVLILLTVSTSFSSLCDRLSFISTVSRFFTELFNGAIRLYFM